MKRSLVTRLQQWFRLTRTEAIAAVLLFGGALVGMIIRSAQSVETESSLHQFFDSVAQAYKTYGVGITKTGDGVPSLVRGDTLVQEAVFFPSAPQQSLPTEPIDLNTASERELQRLPGIGPVIARRIVAYRQNRPFRRIEEILRVKGIGKKTLARIRPYITVGSQKQRKIGSRESATSDQLSVQTLRRKVNINTASVRELVRLPGIGPTLARRIIAYRQRHRFQRIEEIVNVKGIGPKKFERLKHLITTGEE